MPGELSHDLPQLATRDNHVVRSDTMYPILLRGVNRSGLEYTDPSDAGFLAAAELTNAEVREIVSGWRANVIRLPFNQDWALHGRCGHSASEYLDAIDQVISWAAELGAYTILDLQWLDAETVYGYTEDGNHVKSENHVAPTPNSDSLILWNKLARRYRDEPAVLFDLLNEPHNRLADDFLPIHLIDTDGDVIDSDSDLVGPQDWSALAARLVSEVRQLRPKGLILIGGVDWAFDLRGIRVNAPNIVYSTHIYPNRKTEVWWKALGCSGEVPIFVGEWGGTERDLDFGGALANLMRRAGLSWTAWSWVDYPQLVRSPRAPDYQPTTFGHLVQNELRANEMAGSRGF